MSEAAVAPGGAGTAAATRIAAITTSAATVTAMPAAAAPTLAPEWAPGLYGADVATPRRDSLRRRALAVADVFALLGAFALVVNAVPPRGGADGLELLAALPLWVVLNKALRLYDRDANLLHKSTLNELPSVVHSITLGTVLAFLVAPAVTGADIGRPQMAVFWTGAIALTPAMRWVARSLVRQITPPERVLIVGSGHVADLVAHKIAAHPEYGAGLVGYVDVPSDGAVLCESGLAHLGDVRDFERVCHEHDVERVVIAFSSLASEQLLDLVGTSKRLHLKVSVVPRLFEVIGGTVEIDQVEGMTLMGLRGLTRTQSTLGLKRALDAAGAALGLLVLAPLLVAIAVAVKLGSPGPVLFRQERVGRGNRQFRMLKFRTMVRDAENLRSDLEHLNEMAGGAMFKIADDPRVTRVGRLLRRASLDELPQLWNVLRGEMSLVGPRPLIPSENAHVIGRHRARLDLTPGLTGPWQVMGRNAIPFSEMVKLDYLYVAEWSLWNDLKLMVRTLPVVIGRRGH
jgi:exopolysaccharide biosynthesis polyprenyl glycosylphosphotransferase